MKPCTKVGVDITYRCPANCIACFYKRSNLIHKAQDVPVAEVKAKIDRGQAGGMTGVTICGYGEPASCPNTPEIIRYARSKGMSISMISLGVASLDRFKEYFDCGLDHILLSCHGVGKTHDDIVGMPGAFSRQNTLREWMTAHGFKFRSNVTMQQANYRELPQIAEYGCATDVSHFVLLNVIPIYEWTQHASEIAVHPAELRPYIEQASDIILNDDRLLTIRYVPHCHLSPSYWPYITNAKYVFWSQDEWNYELQATDLPALWQASVRMAEALGVTGEPCDKCSAYRHCGGWNRVYAEAFDGAGLQPILDVPPQYADVWERDGGLHDLNPANHETGTMR